MDPVKTLRAFADIKLLADARRMSILRLLMAAPATLSQLARSLHRSPAWIRHHVLALRSANLIEIVEVRTTGSVTEKFYRAKASAFLLQEIILPKSNKPVVIFSGSNDLAMEGIAQHLTKHMLLLNFPVGSLDGLVNLRQGLCQISGAHLLDESGEYNTPYVRPFFPDREVELITLSLPTQAFIVPSAKSKRIQKINDLISNDCSFVKPNPRSGTRACV